MKMRKGRWNVVLDILCLILLVGVVLFLLIFWRQIPEKVPMHYDISGNPDRWGMKIEMLILPVIAWGMYLMLTVIEIHPQVWSTGVKVTQRNRERVYKILLNLINTTKFFMVCIFVYLTVQAAMVIELSARSMPVILLLIFGNILYWSVRLLKEK